MTNKKVKIPVFIFLFFAAMALLFFPFLRGGEIYFKDLNFKDDKAIVISDLHLGSNPRDLKCIGEYIDKNNISTIIFNGDLFDRKFNNKFKESLLNVATKRLDIEKNEIENLIWILALYNHDPQLESGENEIKTSDGNLVVRGILRLKAGGENFYIGHGDFATPSTGVAGLSIVNKITSNLYYERLAKKIVKIEKDDWLFLGHSHVSGIDYENKVANSGCWIDRYFSNTDTALLIENVKNINQRISLVKIPCE